MFRHRRSSRTPRPTPPALVFALTGLALGLVVAPATAEDTMVEEAMAQAPAPEDAEIVSWRERYMALGEDVYQWACAACHSTGEKGAPRMGERSAWTDRSPLWSAVLLEHAKQGYLEMPAKGGHPYLGDRAVEAAGEYMLSKTFPELPRD